MTQPGCDNEGGHPQGPARSGGWPTPARSLSAEPLLYAALGRLGADALARRGDLDGLRALADADDGSAAGPKADLLMKWDGGEEAERLRQFGLNPDG